MSLAASGRWLHRSSFKRGPGLLQSASATYSTVPQPIRTLLAAYQQLKSAEEESPTIQIAGFARSIRTHRTITFVTITDGSLPAETTLQAVIKGKSKDIWDSQLSVGVALELIGRLQSSKGANQPVEFAVDQVNITGQSQASTYPLASSSQLTLSSSPSFKNNLLRKYAHLRPRDARHASVLRTRNVIEKSISDFFWDQGFTRVAAPIITSSDCEGGGQVFKVDAARQVEESESDLDDDLAQEPSLSGSTPDQPPEQDTNLKIEPSLSGSNGDAATKTSQNTSFWSDSEAYLTVSSQLHLEAIALGLGRVYTIGPSFRAESSATNRHLAEFWMCEGEMITSSNGDAALDQVMDVVEGLIKQIVDATLKSGEAEYLWAGDEGGLKALHESAHLQNKWPRMTYTEAIELLQKEQKLTAATWGESLASEHERWLARNGPIFITHYPASIKPFYMRRDEGQTDTVACFDLLVPRIGELVGGSLREERREILAAKLSSSSSSSNSNLHWYVDDLRKYGCNPHGGFGLGMERLVSLVTKTDNLRDCLTFPRVKGPIRF